MTTTIETPTFSPETEKFLNEKGMNYAVQKLPAPHPVTKEPMEGKFWLARDTDGHVVSPKSVGSTYVATSPRNMLVPIAPLISEGWIKPKEAYRLSDGSHEVLSFEILADVLENGGKMVGDEVRHYFQVHNFHGGGSFFGTLYSERVVCTNGMVAITKKGNGFRLRHTGNLQGKYDEAMQTWKEVQDQIRKLSERMGIWNEAQVKATEALSLIQEIYDVEDPNDIATRTQNEIEYAMVQFSNPMRGTHGRTAYDVFNAITATNTHYAPRGSKESELKRVSSMLNPSGSRHKLEARAVEVLSRFG